ncbi:MAG: GNAT family N-acetyltransferase [Chloroflexia bacterium]|nr:GNAT family N-acetyltransferase [Chloroflexia bacterium]
MNAHLIQDEGHRNRMTLPELTARMHAWLLGEYAAVIFCREEQPVGYALYLRQFFIGRAHRRAGIGRAAIRILREEIWPPRQRIRVDVLTTNTRGITFWRAIGFEDAVLTLERVSGIDE